MAPKTNRNTTPFPKGKIPLEGIFSKKTSEEKKNLKNTKLEYYYTN